MLNRSGRSTCREKCMTTTSEYLSLEANFSDLVFLMDEREIAIRLFQQGESLQIQFEYAGSLDNEGKKAPRAPRIHTVPATNRKSQVSTLPPCVFLCEKWFDAAGKLLPRELRSSIAAEVDGLRISPVVEWVCWLTHIWGTRVLSRRLLGEFDVLISAPVEASIQAAKLIGLAARGEGACMDDYEEETTTLFRVGGHGCVIDIKRTKNPESSVRCSSIEVRIPACSVNRRSE